MEKEQYKNYQSYQLNDFLLDENFQRWVQGEKNSFWDHFAEVFPNKENTIKEAYRIVGALSIPEKPLSAKEKERQLAAIYDRLEQRNPKQKNKLIFFTGKWRYAAAVSAVVMFTGLLYYLFLLRPFQYYETTYQQTETFSLDDGTEVSLNANSSLKVYRDLQDKSVREVWLEGEAYFKVTKLSLGKDTSTFVVHTPNLDVQVLGTQFNVRSRDGNTRVLLEEGSVKVENASTQENLLMIPGETVELNDSGGKIKKEVLIDKKELAWQKNFFVFDNEKLSIVAKEIQQYYGIQVTFEDPAMEDYIFTAEVSRTNLPLLQTLIEEAFTLEVKREGNTILLQRKE
ncbi:FecR family protein [Catalinimonas niigatensis]|uniref:FecR family protein n=1 Tax=Catalinimonas niigatensis TaxID=1397264 RepID=UPI002666D00C|nr:FecR domain-containing protein [Catalinimonas niigatensis]WPP51738.1 FecR domain-containing protein [Catalinimonas niigatensis]